MSVEIPIRAALAIALGAGLSATALAQNAGGHDPVAATNAVVIFQGGIETP